MKKLLIATAAMAVVAGAQAQSSVSVYGVVDVNVVSSEVNKAGANSALGDHGLNTGRLGFKGTEDLGGGLKADFQLETKLGATTGATGATATANELFTREAWVGFTSSLGSIRVGTSDVTSAQSIDSAVGQAGNLSDNTSDIGADKNKTVRYTTPNMAGFTAEVGFSNESATATDALIATEATGALDKGTIQSGFIKYEQGNVGLYAGQTTYKKASGYDQKQSIYGVKYNFGVASVGASYAVSDTNTETTNELKQTRVSIAVPVSALGSGVTAHAVYFKDATTNDNAVAVGTTTDTTPAVDGFKLALTKAFSKRTTGYVAYVDQNDSKSGQTTNDAKVYVVGVSHAF
jgi:predicted porin